MGWGRDVIAPLLVACSAATTSSALALSLGGQRLLHLQPSSCSATSSFRGPDNDRCVHCSSFSSASSSLRLTTTATRRQRSHSQQFLDANCCDDVEQSTASTATSNNGRSSTTEVDTETAAAATATATAAAAAAIASPRSTRYTIDVSVHPDVASVAVKHARQLPRFLEHYPISAHTKQAYDRAKDFVRDFHLSRRGEDLDTGSSEEGGGPKEDEDREGTEASGVAAACAETNTGQSPSTQRRQHQQFRVVLDSGCGTGRSSVLLAESYPHLPVLGVDRSAVRLSKGGGSGKRRNNDAREQKKTKIERDGASEKKRKWVCNVDSNIDAWKSTDVVTEKNVADVHVTRSVGSRAASGSMDGTPPNLLLLRADLVDLWILVSRDDAWAIEEHTILYPNPYPKRSQLRGRWHGHPVFPVLLGLGGRITLRSNWKAYLEEVCEAVLAINDAATSTADDRGGVIVGRRQSNNSNNNNSSDSSSGDKTVEAVAAAATASYAASARGGPTVFSPGTPSTNFEAKYVAVGETVYELRLEPGEC